MRVGHNPVDLARHYVSAIRDGVSNSSPHTSTVPPPHLTTAACTPSGTFGTSRRKGGSSDRLPATRWRRFGLSDRMPPCRWLALLSESPVVARDAAPIRTAALTIEPSRGLPARDVGSLATIVATTAQSARSASRVMDVATSKPSASCLTVRLPPFWVATRGPAAAAPLSFHQGQAVRGGR